MNLPHESAVRASDRGAGEMTALRPDIAPLPDLRHWRSRVGQVREERPVYVDLPPPCKGGLPGGREHPGVACPHAGGRARAGLACARDRQSACRDPRAVCYHPCESVCNGANLDSAVSMHSVERYLATWRESEGGCSIRRGRPAASEC